MSGSQPDSNGRGDRRKAFARRSVNAGLFVLLPAVLLLGCAVTGPVDLGKGPVPAGAARRALACCTPAAPQPRQEALAEAAVGFLGRSRIEVGGRRFTSDCSGLARGVYFTQGIDLYDGLGEVDGGNGVGRIYGHVVRHGRIHYGPSVHPGDLVFFHNSWDFNGDGRLNDPLTHVGVVERVEHDGTVIFVSRVSGGIQRYRMNLQQPTMHRTGDGRVLNDYMRRKSVWDSDETPSLTGELFAAFGTLLR